MNRIVLLLYRKDTGTLEHSCLESGAMTYYDHKDRFLFDVKGLSLIGKGLWPGDFDSVHSILMQFSERNVDQRFGNYLCRFRIDDRQLITTRAGNECLWLLGTSWTSDCDVPVPLTEVIEDGKAYQVYPDNPHGKVIGTKIAAELRLELWHDANNIDSTATESYLSKLFQTLVDDGLQPIGKQNESTKNQVGTEQLRNTTLLGTNYLTFKSWFESYRRSSVDGQSYVVGLDYELGFSYQFHHCSIDIVVDDTVFDQIEITPRVNINQNATAEQHEEWLIYVRQHLFAMVHAAAKQFPMFTRPETGKEHQQESSRKLDSDHYAYPAEKRRAIVRHYRQEKEAGKVSKKDAWAGTNYQISGRTLRNYEKEFPET